MKKKQILYYFFFIVQEGVAYYLTHKWSFVFLAALVALFPTILVKWVLFKLKFEFIEPSLIFFLIWLVILAIFVHEIKLPTNLLRKARRDSVVKASGRK